jgi:hypothetical protein
MRTALFDAYQYPAHRIDRADRERRYICEPFCLLAEHDYRGLKTFRSTLWCTAQEISRATPRPTIVEASSCSASLGSFAACLYNHMQATSVLEGILDQPDNLARYRVLYPADLTALSPERLDNVREFVRNGAGLVAGHATSAYNAGGARQERFGLEEPIRVRPLNRRAELDDLMRTHSTILARTKSTCGRARIPNRWPVLS